MEVSKWGTPIVPIIKPDRSVRICGDYKVTVNRSIMTARHLLPRIEHLITNLQGGVFFSKIDLKEAYALILLSNDSKKYLVLNTHRGLFMQNVLPYGISSAPGFFQSQMEQIFSNMTFVTVFRDDIVVKGRTLEECIKNTTVGMRIEIEKIKM